MIKLEFNVFQRKLKHDQSNGHYPTVHCMIDSLGFTFIIKSKEKWEYYTTMTFDLINRYAILNNIDPMEAFDMFITNYCSNTLEIQGVDVLSVNEEINDSELENQDDPLNDDSDIKTTYFSKTPDMIDAGEDVIIEAKDYSDFLLKFFDNMEKKVLLAINSIELEKSYIDKTFGEFMRDLFNSVNTVSFIKQVKKFIKQDLIKGMNSAEAELSIDLGFTDAYKDKLAVLSSQQIDGYIINGKKWPGIKGVTKEIQADIIEIVQTSVNEKKTLNDVKKEIKNKFNVFSDWRSEMIARTETNRIINEGKITGYKESGLKGKKVWISAIDDRTSPICRRLNNQKVLVDDLFIDPETRKAYRVPPSHVNCRSTVIFEQN